jgi:hypothetical protein
MFNMINAYDLFVELLKECELTEIADNLSLHIGTLKRWMQTKKVPQNYYSDLNFLLGDKYIAKDDYRSKDQFYTTGKTAKYVIEKTVEVLNKLDFDFSEHIFIEPSAGNCNFYELLPKEKRIGIDIEPKGAYKDNLIKQNYLSYIPPKGKYIVIGNPPFGLRGNLALRFINHSEKFADVVSFILPPLFNSNGKGVPMKRVKNFKLIHSENLPLDSYYYPDGKTVEIATVFQIWSKVAIENIKPIKKEKVSDYIRVYSLSNGNSPSSKRNVSMINKCDVYLPSTTFSGMKAYDKFEELPHKRGYGVVIYKDFEKIKNILMSEVNWEEVAFLSTNSALNLRTELIENELIKRGIYNGC